MNASIVWFRQDLRLADNPSLHAAARRGAIVPVYVWSPQEEGDWPVGGAGRWWLHQSLERLAESLRRHGVTLIIRTGETLRVLLDLARESGANAVMWNRRYEPAAIARDTTVKAALSNAGLTVDSFNGSLLVEPWEIQNKSGKPFQVFTPMWRRLLQCDPPAAPLPIPPLKGVATTLATKTPKALELLPQIDWAATMRATWAPGEDGAAEQIRRFLRDCVASYSVERDRPDVIGTSRLSPHLHWGEISPRTIWHATLDACAGPSSRATDSRVASAKPQRAPTSRVGTGKPPRYAAPERPRVPADPGAEHFLRELGWREFGYHLLYHFPHTPLAPLRADFADFPWREDHAALRAWQRGLTGVPLVDAGMRELWATGWMHNRVRMVVASYLVKHLLLPWQSGARWFWDTLVDADLASNTLGWQWSAGCGADAAPYFRIFNPVSQGEKFDPEGAYVRRWVPELATLSTRWIHQPWEAPPLELADCGVTLGRTYPRPQIELNAGRERALEAFATLRQAVVD